MVENLNRLSFRSFGEITAETDNSASELLTQTGASFQRFPGAAVRLARRGGMPVLHLLGEDGAVRSFYLDKPVRLRAGLAFLVEFPEGDGAVALSHPDGAPREQAAARAPVKSLFAPALRVGTVYTLFYQEREKGFLFAGEQHRPWELVYVDRGALHSVAGGADYLLRQGDLMFYPPEQWHMQYAPEDTSVCFLSLSFTLSCPAEPPLAETVFTADAAQRRILARLLAEGEGDLALRDDMIQCKLRELLILLLRGRGAAGSAPPESAAGARRENSLIEQAQRWIARNLHRRVTVEEAARGASISPPYLTALFRRHLGIAPGRYISRVRLAEAKRLIREEELSVSGVADSLGYATVQHFSRCFRREFGVSPSQYARSLRP